DGIGDYLAATEEQDIRRCKNRG
ncbi:hypothetical protein CCACVL1_19680, partial [Corchorus capsularis]